MCEVSTPLQTIYPTCPVMQISLFYKQYHIPVYYNTYDL